MEGEEVLGLALFVVAITMSIWVFWSCGQLIVKNDKKNSKYNNWLVNKEIMENLKRIKRKEK